MTRRQALPDLSAFFSPESVAIVGANEELIRLGGRPLHYMRRYEYAGEVYPVHPKHTQIQGLKAYPSLSAIPGKVELVIVAVSAQLVESVVSEGIGKGVKAFIVFSSGYAELGDTGKQAQQRLAELCQRGGVLLLGPNCMGCADTQSRLIASFSTAMETSSLKQGRFGLVTQSGALGSYWMAMVDRQGLGFSKFITTGNEAGVDLAQGIAYLADDDATDVIGVYIESIKNIPRFREAAIRVAAAGKTIVAIKAGRSETGAEAAASHTGSLVGEDAIYQAFFRQFGIIRVHSLSEMIDTAQLLIRQPLPAGRRIGIVTISGGAGALLADELDAQGLQSPDFTEHTKAKLNALLPAYIHARNPLDHTAAVAGDPVLFHDLIDVVGQSDDHDAYIVFSGLLDSIADKLVGSIKQAFGHSSKTLGVIWLGASESVLNALENAGIPVFADIPQAARAFANVAWAVEQRERVKSLAERHWPEALVEQQSTQALSEHLAARRVQAMCDMAFPNQRLVSRSAELADALSVLSFPLVAKLQSQAMPHRSEYGGVIVDLHSESEAQAALGTLLALASSMEIAADGVLFQEMHRVSYELIIGLRYDAQFGPMLMVGRGGIDVELRPDVCSIGLPASPAEIKSLLQELESAELFAGHRGRPEIDLDALAHCLAILADGFISDKTLFELEVNPLAVTTAGRVIALDALAVEVKDTPL